MKTNEMKRLLVAGGCYLKRSGGNHDIWYSDITGQTFSVPRHGNHEIPTGTLKAISKQSGIPL